MRRLVQPQGSPFFSSVGYKAFFAFCFLPRVDYTLRDRPLGVIFMVISPSYTIVCRVFGVSLRDNLLPVSITPSGACVVAVLSHVSLSRLVGSTQVGASSR